VPIANIDIFGENRLRVGKVAWRGAQRRAVLIMIRYALLCLAGLFVWMLYAAAVPWLGRYLISTTACETWDGTVVARPFHKEGKHAYVAEFPVYRDWSDDKVNQRRSPALLCEDGKPIGPAHTLHAQIRDNGAGRYSLWSGTLYFSSSDYTDADANGRRYRIVIPPVWYRVLMSR
jgi:hypothetical protein